MSPCTNIPESVSELYVARTGKKASKNVNIIADNIIATTPMITRGTTPHTQTTYPQDLISQVGYGI